MRYISLTCNITVATLTRRFEFYLLNSGKEVHLSIAGCGLGHLFDAVKFAVKDYLEALNVLESVHDDTVNKCSVKPTSSSQLMMAIHSSSFSVCELCLSISLLYDLAYCNVI